MSRGFTLIELLVVLAIVALMMTIAAPRSIDQVERSREVALKATLREMRHALDQFEADTGRPPGSLDELVTRRYLREIPVDPLTDRRDSWIALNAEERADAAGPPAEGVADVRSGAEGTGRDGTPYRQW
jgi:general secretion pathway protein G